MPQQDNRRVARSRRCPKRFRGRGHTACGAAAFSSRSHEALRGSCPDAVPADGLVRRGFPPSGVGLSELPKTGGSAKCCTLELRWGPGQ